MNQPDTTPIVFLNQSAGTLCVDIVNAFAGQGRHCTLITGTPAGADLARLNPAVRIQKVASYDKSKTWRRLWTWGLATVQMWASLFFRHRRSDVLIVTNPPFTTLLPLLCRNRFWVLTYDMYPEVLIQAGLLRQNGLIAKLWRRAHRHVYARASGIFTIGQAMAERLAQYTDRSRITVIENWADTSLIRPIAPEQNRFRQQQHLDDKFVVMYSGNIGNTHSVETLVEVADLLRDNQEIVFAIIGEGGKKQQIEQMVKERSLPNCLLLGYQPLEMLPHSLSAADIGVITLEAGASQLSVPSKTYNLLAAGCALLCIAGQDSELEHLLQQYDAGKRFDKSDAAGIARFICALKDDPEQLARFRRNALAAATHFTPANASLYVRHMQPQADPS